MKSLQFGSIVAVTACVLALLLGALWLAPGGRAALAAPSQQESTPEASTPEASAPTDAPPIDAAAVQVAQVVVTTTVGTQSGACASSSTAYVRANTTVYYCFRVHNTGDEALTIHNLKTSRGSVDLDVSSVTIEPGQIQDIRTINDGIVLTDTTSVDVTNFVTWTASTSSGAQAVDTSRAFIDVVSPELEVVKSVGQDRTTCPTDRNLRVPSGQSVVFCISLRNTGEITLTQHTVVDEPLGINATFNYPLAPNTRLDIIPANLSTLRINGTLERGNVTAAFTNSARVTSVGGNELSVSDTSTATVEIGTTTVRFTKTVSTEEESCNGTNSITVNPGTLVYYCVTIENSGEITLTHHELTERHLSIDLEFDYVLPPGQTLRVTNGFLREHNQPVVFGPFELHPRFGAVINQAMNYRGSAPDGFNVSTSAGTTGGFPNTPTVTATSRPDPTRTSTPAPTGTPTPTFTPSPVTPSPTPSYTPETPSPTPTLSYAITRLETPTPRSQLPGVPQQNPNQSPLATPDPQQFPGQDPFLATATQIAMDATSTAVVAEATAFAGAQGPQPESPLPGVGPGSPLPTPTIDPSLSQAGNPGELPLPTEEPAVTPFSSPLETPTTDALPLVTALPGDAVTVLPPVETVVVATATSAVVVLVVTNTPEGGEAAAVGQRPIEYPTPTATPDFVMAAARTFDVAVTTFGWLWFLVGSLIFFVTAGIVAGLFFRQSEANRFDLPEPEYWLEEEVVEGGRNRGRVQDEEWPADLP